MTRSFPRILPLLPVLFVACGNGGNAGSAVPAGGDPHTEIAMLDREIIDAPRNAGLYAQRALSNERRDSLHLALNDWNRALTLDSTNSAYHVGIGDLYFRKVRVREAESHFRRAARLDPKAIEPRLKLAEIKLLEREHTEAMGWANDALRIDQQHARGYFLKGWIHMEAGDTALAISSYRTAVEQDPSMHEAFLQLGVLHAAQGDPLAMQYYNSAIDIAPDNTTSLYGLGMFAQENGMDSLAMMCYARIKELEPGNVLPWYNTGYIMLEHQERPTEARRQFHRAIEISPRFPEAWYNRGLTYELDGRLDSAYMDYRQALSLRPDLTAAAEGLGRLQSKGVRVQR